MILNVYKEPNMTSRYVCNILGKHFNTKKVGHTGTLDPLASGVLVILIGKDTTLSDVITSTKKEYIATARLNIKTDTGDITGKQIATSDKKISKEELKNVLNGFIGSYNQEVPIYSAVKVNGKKLYEYARSNIEVELPKRMVTIYDIELLEYNMDTFRFRVVVSKGTYIRSLIEDIASRLNTYATMSNLVRTKQGKFTIENSNKIDDILHDKYTSLNIKDVLDYKIYKISDDEIKRIKNGNKIVLNRRENYLLMVYKEDVVAIYTKDNNYYRVFKML